MTLRPDSIALADVHDLITVKTIEVLWEMAILVVYRINSPLKNGFC